METELQLRDPAEKREGEMLLNVKSNVGS